MFVKYFLKAIPNSFCKLVFSLDRNNDSEEENSSEMNKFTLFQKVFNANSPYRFTLLIIYFLVYHFITFLFFHYIFPSFTYILENPDFHQMFVFIVTWIPWIIVIIFQFVNPGIITDKNVDDFLRIYPYDKVLYYPAKCSHLSIPAVPRSRFCQFTNCRISKYDHYCPWVMKPIGERNIRFYLLFILSNIASLLYFLVVSSSFLQWHLSNATITWTDSFLNNFTISICYLLQKEPLVCGLSVFLFICIAGIFPKLIQEIHLISHNITLSEINLISELVLNNEHESKTKPKSIDKTPEKIVHIYDKGIFQNWFEVLFPEAM